VAGYIRGHESRHHVVIDARDLDLTSSAADGGREIDRLLALGARRVDIGQTGAESWTVLADSEGTSSAWCARRKHSSVKARPRLPSRTLSAADEYVHSGSDEGDLSDSPAVSLVAENYRSVQVLLAAG
jgi:hypothetical protein